MIGVLRSCTLRLQRDAGRKGVVGRIGVERIEALAVLAKSTKNADVTQATRPLASVLIEGDSVLLIAGAPAVRGPRPRRARLLLPSDARGLARGRRQEEDRLMNQVPAPAVDSSSTLVAIRLPSDTRDPRAKNPVPREAYSLRISTVGVTLTPREA